MKKIIILLFVFSIAQSIQAQPPNNTIFYGGTGDGYSNTSYQQIADAALFFGGTSDGWTNQSYQQPSNNPFLGGSGDGWFNQNYQQLADSALFYGGTGDGWIVNNYSQNKDEAIFFGGNGDGWSTVYYPLNPLPIELLSFSGHYDGDFHLLKWQTNAEKNTSHFVIETSVDAISFRELGMVNASGNSSNKLDYQFTNKKPVLGNNFYRLKMVDLDGKSKYSNIVLLKSTKENTTISLYPNPSASVLNVDISSELDNSPLTMQIIDMSGKTIWNNETKKDKVTYQIDISSFANGLYQLRIQQGIESYFIKFNKFN